LEVGSNKKKNKKKGAPALGEIGELVGLERAIGHGGGALKRELVFAWGHGLGGKGFFGVGGPLVFGASPFWRDFLPEFRGKRAILFGVWGAGKGEGGGAAFPGEGHPSLGVSGVSGKKKRAGFFSSGGAGGKTKKPGGGGPLGGGGAGPRRSIWAFL